MEWTAQTENVTSKSRRRLYAINAFFPRHFGSAKQLLFKSIVRSVVDYASSSWHSTGKGLQKQLEGIQKKFLKSIRLGKMDGKDQHDGDFFQYRQHLAEVSWHPLWTRRLEGIMINVFKSQNGTFAGGGFIMKREMPDRTTRSQAKEILLKPVSQAPRSCKIPESTVSSSAYVGSSILKDPLLNPSPRDLLTLAAFKSYLSRSNFSDVKWCKENIDTLLLV
ncbi:hypothetical protein RvY_08557 [Ramazzottius varieornatus]|uniref:Uncharacterized protein n=1 Tax=Ramazzottius varieornatus TaxID=947166 RepID=A0A1D1V6D0_RAMVA|nr:hypothetical protein RvY_08557 [Ramazzottius varieornatus]